MRFVDNGVPEDFARLTFEGLNVPLCELSEEEYMWVVYGVRDYVPKKRRAGSSVVIPKDEAKPMYFDSPIDILELSVRAEHCLQRAGIETIGELCALTEWELAKLRNMGAKSVKEVKDKLKAIGCSLRESKATD